MFFICGSYIHGTRGFVNQIYENVLIARYVFKSKNQIINETSNDNLLIKDFLNKVDKKKSIKYNGLFEVKFNSLSLIIRNCLHELNPDFTTESFIQCRNHISINNLSKIIKIRTTLHSLLIFDYYNKFKASQQKNMIKKKKPTIITLSLRIKNWPVY